MDASPQQMHCMEVWGGSQLTQRSVQFGGLEAWVYSKPHGQADKGGDVIYASSCATGRITRLLLADVAGYGRAVAATAADLRLLMRRFVNRLDQTELVRLLNQQFVGLSERAVFATAIVTTFFSPTRRLNVCNAGHPCPLISTLLAEIADRFPESLSTDDVTVLVVRATSRHIRYPLTQRLWALARVVGTAIGAIRRGSSYLPARRSERDPCHYSDRLLARQIQ